MTAKFQELVAKLKEIFQLDKQELDFGIYRIMHMRAKEIGEFLEKRLAEKVRTALAGNSAASAPTRAAAGRWRKEGRIMPKLPQEFDIIAPFGRWA